MKDAKVKETLAKYEVINVDAEKYPHVIKAFTKDFADKEDKGIPLIMIFSSEGIQTDKLIGYVKAKKFDRILKQNL